MENPQYAILRFAKYKGSDISGIEAHNERTKTNYASNPDIDHSRTHLNFHLVTHQRRYRQEIKQQIAAVGCCNRKDSVKMVEALVTATPEFFQGKKLSELQAFFTRALEFLKQHQDSKTFLSAVVHMDEETPHMHLCFVPLTEDNRLCAKEILGNKKKLTWWQDEFWSYMVKLYPDLERGESASETGRTHIPPRVFKEMTRLTQQKEKLNELLSGVNPLNAKARTNQINKLLDEYIPAVEKMATNMKKYRSAFQGLAKENKKLTAENEQLSEKLENSQTESTLKKLKDAKLERDYRDALAVLERIPKEVLDMYLCGNYESKERASEQGL